MLADCFVVSQHIFNLPGIAAIHFGHHAGTSVCNGLVAVSAQIIRVVPFVISPECKVGAPGELIFQVIPDTEFGRQVGNDFV